MGLTIGPFLGVNAPGFSSTQEDGQRRRNFYVWYGKASAGILGLCGVMVVAALISSIKGGRTRKT